MLEDRQHFTWGLSPESMQERWKEGKGAMERHEREASNGGILNSCLSARCLIDGQGQASFPCQAKTSSCFRKQSWAWFQVENWTHFHGTTSLEWALADTHFFSPSSSNGFMLSRDLMCGSHQSKRIKPLSHALFIQIFCSYLTEMLLSIRTMKVNYDHGYL